MDKHMEVMINRYGMAAAPAAPQMFGNAGREHMEKYGKTWKQESLPFWWNFLQMLTNFHSMVQYGAYCLYVVGTKPEHFAKIAWKNHKHSTNNP